MCVTSYNSLFETKNKIATWSNLNLVCINDKSKYFENQQFDWFLNWSINRNWIQNIDILNEEIN